MNRRTITYHALLLLLLACPPPARASSILMGNLASVHPYGAQDAARNPALLSRQQQKNAIGLHGGYQALASSKIQAKQPRISIATPEMSRLDAGTARVSYIGRINMFSLGLDLSGKQSNLQQTYKSLSWNTNLFFSDGGSKQTGFQGTTAASFSLAIDGSNSVGVKLNCAYDRTTTTEKNRTFMLSAPPVFFHEYSETLSETATVTPEIGYLCIIEHTEIGVMFSPGALSWNKETKEGLSYDLSSLLAQLIFKAKGKRPYYFSYNRGPGFTAGAYTKPAHDLGMALEFDMFFPVSYNNSFLARVDSLIPPISRFRYFHNRELGVKSKITTRPSFSIRGGFESFLSRTVTFNIGAGFNYNIVKSDNKNFFEPFQRSYQHKTSFSVYGMTGVDLLLNKNSTLTIGTVVSYLSISQEDTYTNMLMTFGRELHNSRLKLTIVVADTIVAMSFGF